MVALLVRIQQPRDLGYADEGAPFRLVEGAHIAH